MSMLHKEVLQMVYALPDKSLISLKPLLNELLTAAILAKDPFANISDMDNWDKSLFLESLKKIDDGEYVSFEDALAECGVNFDEMCHNN